MSLIACLSNYSTWPLLPFVANRFSTQAFMIDFLFHSLWFFWWLMVFLTKSFQLTVFSHCACVLWLFPFWFRSDVSRPAIELINFQIGCNLLMVSGEQLKGNLFSSFVDVCVCSEPYRCLRLTQNRIHCVVIMCVVFPLKYKLTLKRIQKRHAVHLRTLSVCACTSLTIECV